MHNYLFDKIKFTNFDFIATNPPWGAKLNQKEKKTLSEKKSVIKLSEVYVHFLYNSLKLLKKMEL